MVIRSIRNLVPLQTPVLEVFYLAIQDAFQIYKDVYKRQSERHPEWQDKRPQVLESVREQDCGCCV